MVALGRVTAAMKKRGSALVFLCHAQEFSGDLRGMRRSRMLNANACQFSEIAFHALGASQHCTPRRRVHPTAE
jgi:hypothetical protein